MKICFFSLNRLAFTGGAEKYILEVSRVFKDKGHRVYYLGDCRPLLVPNVLAGFLTGVKNLRGVWQEFLALLKAESCPEEAAAFIKPERLVLSSFFPLSRSRKRTLNFLKSSDLIFIKNELLDMLAFFLLMLFQPKIKASLLVFSSFIYPSNSRRGRLHNLFYLSPFCIFLVRRFKAVIVSNRADIDVLATSFGVKREKIRLISYGLNPADFPAPSVLPRESDIFRILFVGRLEEQKGVDLLIEVVKRLVVSDQGERLRFTIVGDGPWRDQVVRLAGELPQVKYLGELPRAQVLQEYGRHDLLLVPSRWETFSYVTLEAQFCGLPVVGFDIPGPQDIIEDGKTGRLVPAGSTDGFLSVVEGYVGNGVDAAQRKYICRRAQEMFSVEKTAAALLKL